MAARSNEEKETIAMILWGIWFARNQKVWEEKNVNSSTVVEISMKQKHDWQEAMKVKQLKMSAQPINSAVKVKNTKWTPPKGGWQKLNVDASLVVGDVSYSVGLVLRNEHGEFVRGKNMRFQGSVTVLEAEGRGVEEAIRWIEEQGLHNVEIETDSEITVKAMSKEMQYYNEVGHIFEFCHLKLQQRSDLVINFVKKQANCAAHLLARVPCLSNSYDTFLSPPSLLLETLCNDQKFE